MVSLNVGIGGQADVPNKDGSARVASKEDSRPCGVELDGGDGLPVAAHLLIAMQILYIYNIRVCSIITYVSSRKSTNKIHTHRVPWKENGNFYSAPDTKSLMLPDSEETARI